MKKALILSLLLILPITSYAKDKVKATLFFSPHCHACIKVKKKILPPIKEKYKENIDWEYLNTQDPQNLNVLKSLSEEFGREKALIPSILVGRNFLVGAEEFSQNLEKAIEDAISKRSKFISFEKVNLLDVFKKITVLTVVGSGLVDGVNPCAFAVIVFFISFLTVHGYRKREIICVGLFYCLAVFSTYLLIGLGFFNFFYSFKDIHAVIQIFYYFVALFCFTMGIAAIYDYVKFKKTGDSKEAVLQLPNFLKKRINKVIGVGLREKKERSVFALAGTSFVIGFLVSLLEAACTGQMYVPTIVFILKNTDLKIKAAAYLLLYNLMFIFPLIVVFLLSLAGVKSEKFNIFLKKNVGKIKLIMAAVFFFLGALILYIR